MNEKYAEKYWLQNTFWTKTWFILLRATCKNHNYSVTHRLAVRPACHSRAPDRSLQLQSISASLRHPLSSAARPRIPSSSSLLLQRLFFPTQVYDVLSTTPGSPNIPKNADHNNLRKIYVVQIEIRL